MPIDPAERDEDYRVFETIWKNMDRENHLINHRITWAIVFSGGIFTASAILAAAVGLTSSHMVRGLLFLIMAVLAACGIFFSIRTREGVRAAHSQLDYLKEHYTKRQHIFEVVHGWPRPFGDRHDHLRGNNAAMAFPELMYWTWIFVAIIELALGSVYVFKDLNALNWPVPA